MDRTGTVRQAVQAPLQFQVRQLVEESFNGLYRDEPRGVLGRARVGTSTPGQMRAPTHGLSVSCPIRIAIGCRKADEYWFIGIQLASPQIDILHGVVCGIVGKGRGVPQDILNGILNQDPNTRLLIMRAQHVQQSTTDKTCQWLRAKHL